MYIHNVCSKQKNICESSRKFHSSTVIERFASAIPGPASPILLVVHSTSLQVIHKLNLCWCLFRFSPRALLGGVGGGRAWTYRMHSFIFNAAFCSLGVVSLCSAIQKGYVRTPWVIRNLYKPVVIYRACNQLKSETTEVCKIPMPIEN